MICCIQHICAVSLHCVLLGAYSNLQLQKMICRIRHSCAASPRCELADVSSDVELDWKICCNLSMCVSLSHYVSTSASSEFRLDWMICCIHHMCAVSLHCVLSGAFSNFQIYWMLCCNAHICAISLQRDSTYLPVQFPVLWSICEGLDTHVARMFIHNFEELECSPSRLDNYCVAWRMVHSVHFPFLEPNPLDLQFGMNLGSWFVLILKGETANSFKYGFVPFSAFVKVWPQLFPLMATGPQTLLCHGWTCNLPY